MVCFADNEVVLVKKNEWSEKEYYYDILNYWKNRVF